MGESVESAQVFQLPLSAEPGLRCSQEGEEALNVVPNNGGIDALEVAGVCLSEVGGQVGEERHSRRDGMGETRAKYINRIHSRTMAITPEAETLFRIDLPPSSRCRYRITEPEGLSPPAQLLC